MAFEISFFAAIVDAQGAVAQIPAGNPIDVQTTSPVLVPTGAHFMRINPRGGTIVLTWPNTKAETFDSTEYRGCTPGTTLQVA